MVGEGEIALETHLETKQETGQERALSGEVLLLHGKMKKTRADIATMKGFLAPEAVNKQSDPELGWRNLTEWSIAEIEKRYPGGLPTFRNMILAEIEKEAPETARFLKELGLQAIPSNPRNVGKGLFPFNYFHDSQSYPKHLHRFLKWLMPDLGDKLGAANPFYNILPSPDFRHDLAAYIQDDMDTYRSPSRTHVHEQLHRPRIFSLALDELSQVIARRAVRKLRHGSSSKLNPPSLFSEVAQMMGEITVGYGTDYQEVLDNFTNDGYDKNLVGRAMRNYLRFSYFGFSPLDVARQFNEALLTIPEDNDEGTYFLNYLEKRVTELAIERKLIPVNTSRNEALAEIDKHLYEEFLKIQRRGYQFKYALTKAMAEALGEMKAKEESIPEYAARRLSLADLPALIDLDRNSFPKDTRDWLYGYYGGILGTKLQDNASIGLFDKNNELAGCLVAHRVNDDLELDLAIVKNQDYQAAVKLMTAFLGQEFPFDLRKIRHIRARCREKTSYQLVNNQLLASALGILGYEKTQDQLDCLEAGEKYFNVVFSKTDVFARLVRIVGDRQIFDEENGRIMAEKVKKALLVLRRYGRKADFVAFGKKIADKIDQLSIFVPQLNRQQLIPMEI